VKLGLNIAVFSDCSLKEALKKSANLGIETVEINVELQDKLTPGNKLVDSVMQKELTCLLTEYGMSLSVIGNHAETLLIGGPHHKDTDKIFNGDYDNKIAFGKKQLLNAARIASDLEVETVVGFTGCEDWSRWFPWPDPDGWEKMLEPFVEIWNPLLDEIGRLGVRFAHEPHPKQFVYNLETAIIVNDALGNRKEWGYNLDAANIMFSGVDPAAFVQALPNKIFHVHAKDLETVEHNISRSGHLAHGSWDRPDRGVRFRIPGWGNVNWKSLISELQLADYDGSVSIEHEDAIFSRDEGVQQAVKFLDSIIIRQSRQPQWW